MTLLDKKKRTIIAIAIIALAIAAAVAGFLLLPDTVVTQLSFSGENATTMPKAVALAIPLVLAVGGTLLYCSTEEWKYLLVAAVGLIVNIIMFIVNL